MRTLYKFIFLTGLGIISLTATAQKDSTLIRQVLLEREYNPTLQDASKINTLPAIYSPAIKTKELKFINSTPQITLKNNQLGSAESGDIMTDVAFSKKRGYLNLGAGTNSNLDGAIGYRIVNSEKDRLDLFATHSSTSSSLDYNQKGYVLEEAKAKYSASKINLNYSHAFDPSILSLGASFYNTSYNYYGNSFLPLDFDPFPYDITSRQSVNVFSIGAGIKLSETNGGELKYLGNINYRNFKNKYALSPSDKGPKGGQLDMDLDFHAEFDSNKAIGIKGLIMNQSFNTNEQHIKDAYHSFTNITGTPYFKVDGNNWKIDLGLNVSALFDIKTKVHISPNVKAQINIYDVNVLYGEVTGGVNNNTYLDILQENRYVNLNNRVEYSKTMFDAKIGFKSGVVSGMEFDLFAGYKKTDKDHLYLPTPSADYTPVTDIHPWANVGTPVYANISTGHVGGLIKTNLIPYTDISAKIIAYFYDVKYKNGYVNTYNEIYGLNLPNTKKAWGRPSFTAEFNADVKPFSGLTLSLNYLYGGGRKTYMDDNSGIGTSLKIKDINELNIKGEYQITDWVSVNARLNNVLNQKYEMYYGYPLQGFNVLGGLSFKF